MVGDLFTSVSFILLVCAICCTAQTPENVTIPSTQPSISSSTPNVLSSKLSTTIVSNSAGATINATAVIPQTPAATSVQVSSSSQPPSTPITSTTASTSSTPYVMKKLCVTIKTRIDEYLAPAWWFEKVAGPMDRVYCAIPRIVLTFINGTRSISFVRATDGQPATDVAETCRLTPEFSRAWFVSEFYEAFYGTPVALPSSNRLPALYGQVVFYCTPLSIFTLALGLIVIRKLVSENNSAQIFTYHLAIVLTDGLIYVANALWGARFLAILLAPICFISPMVFAFGFSQGYSDEFGQDFIDGAYCLSCCIQAAMALDRYFALYHPMTYHVRVTPQTSKWCVAVVVIVNAAIGLVELLSNVYFVRIFANDFDTSTPIAQAFYVVNQARIFVRILLFNAGLLVQVFSCAMVFVKMSKIVRQPVAKRSTQTRQSMASCYLLFGTCVLSFVGATLSTVRLILASDPLLGSQRLSNDTISKLGYQATFWARVATPICSGLGFYVHCLASAQYRELLMNTKGGLWFKKNVWARIGSIMGGKAVGPSSAEASSSHSSHGSGSSSGITGGTAATSMPSGSVRVSHS